MVNLSSQRRALVHKPFEATSAALRIFQPYSPDSGKSMSGRQPPTVSDWQAHRHFPANRMRHPLHTRGYDPD